MRALRRCLRATRLNGRVALEAARGQVGDALDAAVLQVSREQHVGAPAPGGEKTSMARLSSSGNTSFCRRASVSSGSSSSRTAESVSASKLIGRSGRPRDAEHAPPAGWCSSSPVRQGSASRRSSNDSSGISFPSRTASRPRRARCARARSTGPLLLSHRGRVRRTARAGPVPRACGRAQPVPLRDSAAQHPRWPAPGQDVILAPDVQGASTVRWKLPNAVTHLSAPAVARRACPAPGGARHGDRQRSARFGCDTAEREMQRMSEYDYVIVNQRDRLDQAVRDLKAIVMAERFRASCPTACSSSRCAIGSSGLSVR